MTNAALDLVDLYRRRHFLGGMYILHPIFYVLKIRCPELHARPIVMTTDGKLSRNSVLEGGSRVRGTPSHYPPAQRNTSGCTCSYSAQMNDRMASRSMNDQMASHSVPMAHSCTQEKPNIYREREPSWRMPVTSLAGAHDQPLPVTSRCP